MKVTNCFLIGLKACLPQKEMQSWYYKPDKNPLFGELIDSVKGPTAIILLNRPSIILPSKFISLPQMKAALRPHQRSSSL